MKPLLSFFVSLLIVVGGVCGTATNAHAQCGGCPCPNIAGWYPTVPWLQSSDTIVYTVNGVRCSTAVCYCYRNLLTAPITEIFLCAAGQLNPPCTGFNGWDVRDIEKFLTEEILKQNPGGVFPPCPECPIGYPNYRTFYAACKTGNVYCYNITAACTISYSKCCIDGEPQITETGRQFLGTCPDGCEPDSCYW